jgi:hypothetical protein
VFALTRLRLPIIVIVSLALAALLALAAFSSAEAAEQKDAAKEKTDAATNEDTISNEDTVSTEFHRWELYHWGRTSNTFSLKLGNNVTSAWDSYLAAASADWSKGDPSYTDVLDTTTPAGNVSSKELKRKLCPPTGGQVEVCNAKYGGTGWSGLAQIWIVKDPGADPGADPATVHDLITAGVVKMNDTYFRRGDEAKRSHVMCQEIGHTFGLGHTSEDGTSQGTCMDYSNDSTKSLHPYPHDFEELATIYNHADITSTVDSTSQLPAATKRDNYDTPDKWGTLKHRDEAGKHAVFEREFSDETKLVTFVEVEDQEILGDQEDEPQQKKQEEKEQDQ